MNIRVFLRQTVEVSVAGEPNRYGETEYADPVSYPARKETIQRQVRNPQGTEVYSSTKVMMVEEFEIGDLIDGEAIQDRENAVLLSGQVAAWVYYL